MTTGLTGSADSADDGAAPTTPANDSGLPEGCRAQLDQGAKVVTAADASYRDWNGHAQADLDYRSGKNTWEKTQGIWADTKSRGEKDVAGFNTADKAYASAGGSTGCSTVDRAAATPEVKSCLDRFAAMQTAMTAGRKVNNDWNAHVQMMKRKPATNADTYTREWREMVGNSGPNLRSYATARAAYGKAPACSA